MEEVPVRGIPAIRSTATTPVARGTPGVRRVAADAVRYAPGRAGAGVRDGPTRALPGIGALGDPVHDRRLRDHAGRRSGSCLPQRAGRHRPAAEAAQRHAELPGRGDRGPGVGAGDHVVHVGCGTGYYTAILAELVGPGGRVTACDIDPELASRAREHLAGYDCVQVQAGDGCVLDFDAADAVYVNAGATHIVPGWPDRLTECGRLLLPGRSAGRFPSPDVAVGAGRSSALHPHCDGIRSGGRWSGGDLPSPARRRPRARLPAGAGVGSHASVRDPVAASRTARRGRRLAGGTPTGTASRRCRCPRSEPASSLAGVQGSHRMTRRRKSSIPTTR